MTDGTSSGRYRGRIDGIKVFSASRVEERNALGSEIGKWLDEHGDVEVVETIVTQSSCAAHHCVTVTLLCEISDRGGDRSDGDGDLRFTEVGGREAPRLTATSSVTQAASPTLSAVRSRDQVASPQIASRLGGAKRDIRTVIDRISSSATTRELIGPLNLERLEDAERSIAAVIGDA